MSVTLMGDTDMTKMRAFFVKPQTAVAMDFSDDPMMGMTCDRFSGSATAKLPTQLRCARPPCARRFTVSDTALARDGAEAQSGISRTAVRQSGFRCAPPGYERRVPHSIPSACI